MKTFLMGLFGPLLLCACVSTPDPDAPLPWDPQVTQGTLANGLQYRLVRETSQPGRLDLRLTVNAGSVDEADDQVGVAHMVEHLVFRSRAGQAGKGGNQGQGHGGAGGDGQARAGQVTRQGGGWALAGAHGSVSSIGIAFGC